MVIDVKICLQRDISDIYARYEAYNGRGELIYRVRGRSNPSGESLTVTDTGDNTLCVIRRLGFSALSVFSIRASGESMGLNIAVAGGRATARFRGISFRVRGDILTGSYDILDADNSPVCAVYKDHAKDQLILSVEMPEREMFCIAAAVCIDSLSPRPEAVLQAT